MGENNQIPWGDSSPLGAEAHDIEIQVVAVNEYTQLLSSRDRIQIQGGKTPDTVLLLLFYTASFWNWF